MKLISRQLIIRSLQVSIAIFAFAWLVSQVNWGQIMGHLRGVEPAVLVVIIAITIGEFGTRFAMWYVLLDARHPSRFATAAQIDLVIKFVNHVIPSKVSGHSIAPLVLRHYSALSWTDAISVAGVNTGFYALLYGTVSIIGILLFYDLLPDGLLVLLGLSSTVYFAVGVSILVVGRRLYHTSNLLEMLDGFPIIRSASSKFLEKLPAFTEDSATVFRDLTGRPRVIILYLLSWAGTLMIIPGIRVWLLFGAFGSNFSPELMIPIVLVMAYSVTLLPLTPGGIGIAEASASLVFISLGIPENIAIPVILLDRTFGVYLPALLGAYPVAQLNIPKLLAREA